MAIEEHWSTAETFLEAMSRPQLKAEYGHLNWLFRGHADARWKLVAAAFRESSRRILEWHLDRSIVTREDQIRAEWICLNAFFIQVDDAGLPLPGDNINLRRHFRSAWNEIRSKPIGARWIDHEFWPWVALAQHYGVPTRLLDWSKSPEKAAYFAASDAASRLYDGTDCGEGWERLAVWAFSTNSLTFENFHCGTILSSQIPITLVKVPRASNPNLHAQDGMLTATCEMGANLDDEVDQDCLTNTFSRCLTFGDVQPNLFKCFTLPISQAPALLNCLAEREIHAATMFPTYSGSVRAIFERAWRN